MNVQINIQLNVWKCAIWFGIYELDTLLASEWKKERTKTNEYESKRERERAMCNTKVEDCTINS